MAFGHPRRHFERPFEGFLLSAWASYPGVLYHEALLRAGFDALSIDMQHGLCTLEDVREGVLRAKLFERPAFVRVPVGDLAGAARCLDFGAQGVILPMIQSVEDAEAFVEAVKYPPLGMRSYGPTRAAQIHRTTGPNYFAMANEAVIALAMIETAGAMDDLSEILGVDGLDGVFVGPSDLSLALGSTQPEPTAPATEEAVKAIVEETRAAGRIPAIYALTPEDARRYRAYGYEIVCLMSDIAIFESAVGAAVKAAQERGAPSGVRRRQAGQELPEG